MNAKTASIWIALAMAGGTIPAQASDVLPYRNPSSVDMTVTLDFAEVMKIDRAASTVVIGNSGMIDANLSGPGLVVLTGKASGVTNMILVNENGERIKEYLIEVVPSRRKLTTVHQGDKLQTYQCGKSCVPVLAVGDSQEHFSTTKGQMDNHSSFSENNTKKETIIPEVPLPGLGQ